MCSYLDINTPVLRDLEKQTAEAAAKAAAAAEAKRAATELKMQTRQANRAKAAAAALEAAKIKAGDATAVTVAEPTRITIAPSSTNLGDDEDAQEQEESKLGGDSSSAAASLAPGQSATLASRVHFQSKLSLPKALFAYLRALMALVLHRTSTRRAATLVCICAGSHVCACCAYVVVNVLCRLGLL